MLPRGSGICWDSSAQNEGSCIFEAIFNIIGKMNGVLAAYNVALFNVGMVVLGNLGVVWRSGLDDECSCSGYVKSFATLQ